MPLKITRNPAQHVIKHRATGQRKEQARLNNNIVLINDFFLRGADIPDAQCQQTLNPD